MNATRLITGREKRRCPETHARSRSARAPRRSGARTRPRPCARQRADGHQLGHGRGWEQIPGVTSSALEVLTVARRARRVTEGAARQVVVHQSRRACISRVGDAGSGPRSGTRAASTPWTCALGLRGGGRHRGKVMAAGWSRARLGAKRQSSSESVSRSSASAPTARAFAIVASTLPRWRTMPDVAEQAFLRRGPRRPAMRSTSQPSKALTGSSSRLRRIVSHDRPDWNASRVSSSK